MRNQKGIQPLLNPFMWASAGFGMPVSWQLGRLTDGEIIWIILLGASYFFCYLAGAWSAFNYPTK